MSVEWLDVVDEENCVTGRKTRHTVHQRGLWHRGVHVFLFTSDGRLLVQRRSQAQDTYPGALDCSVSEHLRAGESYRAAAVRGLREELGLEALRLRRLVQFRMAYGPNDNMINELYEGIYDGELPAVDRREIAGIAYHTLPELEEMQAAGQIPFSSWFVQLLRWYAGRPSALQVLWSGREP